MKPIECFIAGIATGIFILALCTLFQAHDLNKNLDKLTEAQDNYTGLLLKRISDLEDLKNEL